MPPVELVGLRSRTSRHFDNGDGTRTAEVHAGPIHYGDVDGVQQKIDTYLVSQTEPGQTHRCSSSTLDVSISKLHVPVRLTVPKSGARITIDLVGVEVVSGLKNLNKIFYENAYTNTDVDRYVTPEGFRQDFTLKAAGHPTVFTQRLTGVSVIEVLADGSLRLENPMGHEMFMSKPFIQELTAPWLESPPWAKQADLNWSVDGMDISIDLAQIDLTGWQYPMTIDPTITPLDTAPAWGRASSAVFATARASGTYGTRSTATLQGLTFLSGGIFYIDRAFLQFDTSAIPDSATIDSATLSLWAYVPGGTGSITTVVPTDLTALDTSDDFDQSHFDTGSPRTIATFVQSPGTGAYTVSNSFNLSNITINKTGTTYMGLRGANDCSNTPDSGENYSQWHSTTSGKQAKLTVNYTEVSGSGLLFFLNN